MYSSKRYVLWLGLLLIISGRAVRADDFWPREPLDDAKATVIVQKSEDRRKLEQACLALARSTDPKALPKLGEFLLDPAFSPRLDDPDKLASGLGQLRLSRVLAAVAKTGGPSASDLLVKLSENKQFLSNYLRQRSLIEAVGFHPKPPEKLLRAVDAMGTADSPLTMAVAEALARVNLPESLKLLENRVVNPAFDAGDRGAIARRFLMALRNEPQGVEIDARLLAANIHDVAVQDAIVESLFDYQPLQWYGILEGGGDYPPEPKRQDASTTVLKQLRELSDKALKWELRPNTKKAVLKAQKEIDEILASREKK